MTNDHAVAPARAHIRGVDHDPVSRGIHGVTEIGVAPSLAVPILPEMTVRGIASINIIAIAVRLSHRDVEAVGELDSGHALSSRTGAQAEPEAKSSKDLEGNSRGAHAGCSLSEAVTYANLSY
jgi:hypothetical protein